MPLSRPTPCAEKSADPGHAPSHGGRTQTRGQERAPGSLATRLPLDFSLAAAASEPIHHGHTEARGPHRGQPGGMPPSRLSLSLSLSLPGVCLSDPSPLLLQDGQQFAQALCMGELPVLELAVLCAACAAQPFEQAAGMECTAPTEAMRLWQMLDVATHVRLGPEAQDWACTLHCCCA